MSKNVVTFPVKNNRTLKLDNDILSDEELAMRKEEFHKKYISFMVSEIVPQIVTMIAMEGYDLENEDCIADAFLFSESILSMIYKSKGYDYPLQNFAEKYLEDYVLSQTTIDNGTEV